MPYKPRVIIFLSLIYFFSPPVILIFSSYVSLVPLTGPAGVIARLSPGDISVLAVYYFLSLCLFSVRKWGWWGFIAGSLYLVSYNLYGFVRNPFYTPLSAVLFTLLLSSAAALLFRKELIAPYFNPRLRWWEGEKRYELSFQCRINTGKETLTVPVTDISRGGCFLALDRPAPLSLPCSLEISTNGLFVTLKGEVIRGADQPVRGWGILFRDVSLIESRGLKELISLLKVYHADGGGKAGNRKHSRYANPYYVFMGGEAVSGGKRIHCTIENISRSGFCLILDSGKWLNEDRNMTLDLASPLYREGDTRFGKPLPARIIWRKTLGEPVTLGAEFFGLGRRDKGQIAKLIRDFRRMGGKVRHVRDWDNKKLIEAGVSLSPRGRIASLISRGNERL